MNYARTLQGASTIHVWFAFLASFLPHLPTMYGHNSLHPFPMHNAHLNATMYGHNSLHPPPHHIPSHYRGLVGRSQRNSFRVVSNLVRIDIRDIGMRQFLETQHRRERDDR